MIFFVKISNRGFLGNAEVKVWRIGTSQLNARVGAHFSSSYFQFRTIYPTWVGFGMLGVNALIFGGIWV